MSPPSEIDLDALPPEIRAAFEAERARRAALEAEVATLAEHNRRLEHLVKEFQHALYGRGPEKLDADARKLAFEDLETAVADAEEAQERVGKLPPRPATAARAWSATRGGVGARLLRSARGVRTTALPAPRSGRSAHDVGPQAAAAVGPSGHLSVDGDASPRDRTGGTRRPERRAMRHHGRLRE